MQFQCNQGHKFHYPQKHIVNSTNQNSTPISYPTVATETMVCPICQSLTFTEYTEPAPQLDALEDMQLVEFKDTIGRAHV